MMESALRDAVATHVLQSALQGASATTLDHFWEVYVRGRLAKLGQLGLASLLLTVAGYWIGRYGETTVWFAEYVPEGDAA